jgi:hypothetical protein
MEDVSRVSTGHLDLITNKGLPREPELA